jgi:NAD(P)-dependent dehydrogenase (short-subunit alcohol dehydrogenase family)
MSDTATIDFAGAHVVVVGASRGGIGSAIASGFARHGATVVITGLEDEPVGNPGLRYRKLDVTDADDVRTFVGELDAIDVVVNCAAIVRGPDEADPDTFKEVLDVNINGHYTVASAVRRKLAETHGSLIGIASMYAQFGSPVVPAYGASKAAIAQLTKSLAIAWAPDSVRVNAIAPGFVVTEQTEPLRRQPGKSEEVVARTPAGRWGKPEDLVGPALFLASGLAGFITGITLPVDGGYSVA